MTKILSLIIGGGIGTLARYFLTNFTNQMFGSNFPYGTVAVNLTGCFLVGFLASLANEHYLFGVNTRLLLIVGFCGGFTTFSAFMLETDGFLKDGDAFRTFVNVSVSLIFGFLALRLGMLAAKTF